MSLPSRLGATCSLLYGLLPNLKPLNVLYRFGFRKFRVQLVAKLRFLAIRMLCCASIKMDRYSLARRFPDQCRIHFRLAMMLVVRFEANGHIEDLNEAIDHYRYAIYLMQVPQPNAPKGFELLRLYAVALNTRYSHTGQIVDLEEAILRTREGLTFAPAGHLCRAQLMGNLGAFLMSRSDHTSDADDRIEAIRVLQETMESPMAQNATTKSVAMMELGVAYFSEVIHDGQMEKLDKAVSHMQTALQGLSPSEPARMRALFCLGHTLLFRYNTCGDSADLDAGIPYLQEALQTRPRGTAERAHLLRLLALGLLCRFHVKRQLQDLEFAVDLYRQAVDQSIKKTCLHDEALLGLAGALISRSEETGNLGDIDEALALCQGALEYSAPADYPMRSRFQAQHADILLHKFYVSHDESTLERAINIRESLASQLPARHARKIYALRGLAELYRTRFEVFHSPEDLDKSVKLLEEITLSLSEGNILYSLNCYTLALCLNERFTVKNDKEDLSRSISLCETALARMRDEDARRSNVYLQLATSLWLRSQVSVVGKEEDCDKAMDLFRHSAELVTSRISDRLCSGINWAQCARKSGHPSTLEAYRMALSLIELSLQLSPTVQLQQEFLSGAGFRGAPSLAMDAASYALEIGDIAGAVEILEQGRALLWSEVRGLRTRPDRLAGLNYALKRKFESVARELDALATSSSKVTIPNLLQPLGREDKGPPALGSDDVVSRDLDRMYRRKRALASEFQSALNDIRNTPGFNDFLLAKPFAELQKAAIEGPVIMVNHSIHRSDAIIVVKDREPVSIRLSDEFYEQILRLEEQLLSSQNDEQHGPGSKEYNNILSATMTELWRLVVGRVVDELKNIGIEENSRIWWCPTSALTSLPLHAAAKTIKLNNESTLSFLSDIYISSYTPTLTALIHARSGTGRPGDLGRRPRFLVVGQPDENLISVEKEVRRIRKAASSGTIITCLMGSEGKCEIVQKKLREHEWVHFACHGHITSGDPFDSSFQLYDDSRLTLLDIVKANIPNAELAFLSACHTAEQAEAASREEVISLATAMQICGFKSVVGTMWASRDKDAPVVAKKFYSFVLSKEGGSASEVGFKRSARALCEATRFMRKDDPQHEHLERWVNFIHIGA